MRALRLARRRKSAGEHGGSNLEGDGLDEQRQLFPIEFDMMLKGSIFRRGKTTIRQYGVTVRGSTRLVTSGDVVDRETYEALVKVGAVRPPEPGPLDQALPPGRPLLDEGVPPLEE